MPTVERSIDVNVDVTTAYDQWSRFDSFPQWMEGAGSPSRRTVMKTQKTIRTLAPEATMPGLRRGSCPAPATWRTRWRA